ncbi:MAG: tRNA lysidine(34) synthetase [Bacteroidota bacterium]
MRKKDKQFLQRFYAITGACIREHNMIADGDKLMLGVSGGKDSLALLKTLAGRKKFSDKQYALTAVFVDIGEIPYKTDVMWLKDYCNELNVPLHIEYVSVDFSKSDKATACFYCSWHRRKTLFELGQSMGFNKIVLGHHRDDALETMMLNMLSHGTFSSMPGMLPMFDGRIKIIRPLLYHTDAETREFARIMQFPLKNQPCPFEDKTRRVKIRHMLDEMENRFPAARKNMFKAMSQIYIDYLPVVDKKKAVISDHKINRTKDKT